MKRVWPCSSLDKVWKSVHDRIVYIVNDNIRNNVNDETLSTKIL